MVLFQMAYCGCAARTAHALTHCARTGTLRTHDARTAPARRTLHSHCNRPGAEEVLKRCCGGAEDII
jgi:hypothetical protein